MTPKQASAAIDDPSVAEDERPPVPEAFAVRDAATANWLVRKVVEARAYARRVAAWAECEVRRAQRDEQRLLGRYGGQLEDWVRRRLKEENGRRKSVSLPAGTVGFRAEPPRLVVHDEKELLRWCRAHLPSAVATVERVLRGTVREHVAATGELPQGAEVAHGGEKFFVK
jgi:hypothetical protein